MDEHPLSELTRMELGITVPQQILEKEIPDIQSFKAYLPAIPEHVPAGHRLVADLIDLTALVTGATTLEERDILRNSLVRNADGSVHYAALFFEPEIKPNGDVHAVSWYSNLPKKKEAQVDDDKIELEDVGKKKTSKFRADKPQKIVPLVYVGPEYLKPLGNNQFMTGGTLQCILFRSETNGAYGAMPIGLADKKTIDPWNVFADAHNKLPDAKNKQWILIEQIPHDLRNPAVRLVQFTPRFDLHANLVSGCKKRQLLGCHFGQNVYLAPKANIPIPDNKDGVLGFHEKHLFRVKRLTRSHIEVIWLGPLSNIKIEERLFIEEVENEMDPFFVLNSPRLFTNWRTIDQTTRRWVNGNRPFDQTNPLYRAGLVLGLVKETDDPPLKRAHLEQLWKKAVERVRVEMLQAAEIARKQLEIAPKKPTEKEIRGGVTEIETLRLYLNEPEDAAAIWIGRVFEKPFDPKSPFLMHLRAWLINSVVRVTAPTAKIAEPETEPPPITREISHPAFKPSETFVAAQTLESPEEIVIDNDELEEVFEAETTTLDFDLHEIGFPVPGQSGINYDPAGLSGPLPPDETPHPKFFAKPGSIMHQGPLKDGYKSADK